MGCHCKVILIYMLATSQGDRLIKDPWNNQSISQKLNQICFLRKTIAQADWKWGCVCSKASADLKTLSKALWILL